jgi:hypothetical protein
LAAPAGVTWSAAQAANGAMAWSYITANQGGRMTSGAITQAGIQYNLSWTVTDQGVTGPTATGAYLSPYKDVAVAVAWTGGDNITQTVNLAASIPDTPPSLTELATTAYDNKPGPQLRHSPGARPEVVAVPIQIDGGNTDRETSKPLPTVKSTADSTLVTFDVVNYSPSTGVIQRREEFATISCKCTFAGTGMARTPAKVALVGSLLRDQPGTLISKTIGAPANTQQPDLCAICCRDHHDNGNGDRYSPGATFGTPDHPHYLKAAVAAALAANTTPSPVTSGDYDEACRLKRVNGVFQVFQDWQLHAVTVMPRSDLDTNSTKGAEYVAAVQGFIDAYASAKATSGPLPTTLSFTPSAVSINPATSQLLARAIYVDDMPANLVAKINDILTDADTTNDVTVRGLVPFYEVHMTKLADWRTNPDLNRALVTSEGIETDNEGLADLEPYSRGFVQPAANPTAGNALIVASIKSHNTGVTGTLAVNTDEKPHPRTAVSVGNGQNATTYYSTGTTPASETASPPPHRDGTLTVQVAANGPTITISGTMSKAAGSGIVDSGMISVPTVTGGNCTATSAGQGLEAFTCTVSPGPSGWTGSIQSSSTASPAYVF